MDTITSMDFRKTFAADVQAVKRKSRAAWEIIRYGRVNDLMDVLNYAIEYARGKRHELTETWKLCGNTVSVRFAKGASKVVVIVDNAICIKATYNVGSLGDQTTSEVAFLQSMLNDSDEEKQNIAKNALCPVFRFFPCRKGEGKYYISAVSICPCVDRVCSWNEATEETDKDDITKHQLMQCGIYDLHSGNCGIYNGRPVVIDYGLNDNY